MSIFFYVAKGMIVFIGGAALGVYMFNRYGDGDPTAANDQLQNTIGIVKNMISKKEEVKENYNNYEKFKNLWWSSSRV